MGHSNPRRARREMLRENERLSKMTEDERRKEREAEELYNAKAEARAAALKTFSDEEKAVYDKIQKAIRRAESNAQHAWYWDKHHGGTGKKNPWRSDQ